MFNMKMRLPSKKFIIGMLSIMIVIAVLFTVAPAVSAEGFSPDSPIPGLGRLPDATLMHMHVTERGWYTDQDSLIQKANALAKTFQTLIDAETKAGKDVADLQDALANYNNELIAAAQIHANAANIIFDLAAWKGNGDIYDRMLAGQSLQDGRATIQDANFRLTNGMFILQKSFTLWRAQHIHSLGEGTPVPTPSCVDSSILPCPVY
jgi:hypothetical protein